ncbi:hypothetical protein [Amycolatopsis sp. cmx-4-54]|uniref:hypothetical protein n=1 Tax=Amycolatopsis sp. cmx-4-54 TaxID=2790936 RepID=UPI00397DBCC9
MLHVLRDTTGQALHKVAVVQPRPDRPPRALCGLCGWSETADPPGDTPKRALSHASTWNDRHRGRCFIAAAPASPAAAVSTPTMPPCSSTT